MVYREKPQRNVTVLTGGKGGDAKSNYWLGSSAAEAASVTAGWTVHANTPTLTEKNDPGNLFTPIPGGIQFNAPGTYEVEAAATITGGVASVRFGFGFYTAGPAGSIAPSAAAAGSIVGGSIIAPAALSPWYIGKSTFVVSAAGAQVKMQDYVQTTTSHTCAVQRIMATKIVQGSAGPQGLKGDKGDTGNTGPKGTRWGTTPIWPFADNTDIPCTMFDGMMPAVGDWVLSTNGFSIGEVYAVTAVYPSGNVDVAYPGLADIQGIPGTRWGTCNVSFPGGAGATLAGVVCTFNDGAGFPRAGDLIQNLHPNHIGEVYFISTPTYASFTSEVKKFNPLMNIRGATGPAGDALSHWPIDSVYTSFSPTNPATFFGGTWTAIGTGRMLIGVDPSDTTMDAAGDTGGTKTETILGGHLPPHAHSIAHTHDITHAHSSKSSATAGGSTLAFTRSANTSVTDGGGMVSQYAGDTGAASPATSGNGPGTSVPMNNLPPYLAVYMWRRTA